MGLRNWKDTCDLALGALAEGIALRCGARGVVNHLQVDEPEHRPVSAIIPEDAPRVTTLPAPCRSSRCL